MPEPNPPPAPASGAPRRRAPGADWWVLAPLGLAFALPLALAMGRWGYSSATRTGDEEGYQLAVQAMAILFVALLQWALFLPCALALGGRIGRAPPARWCIAAAAGFALGTASQALLAALPQSIGWELAVPSAAGIAVLAWVAAGAVPPTARSRGPARGAA